jgi:hypothetical protein
MLAKVRGTQLVYLEDMSRGSDNEEGFLEHHDVADDAGDPMAVLRDQRLRESLVAAIKNLPEREQFVMSMYYEQDMNLKEIAAVLGVTESRVCQLHSQSIAPRADARTARCAACAALHRQCQTQRPDAWVGNEQVQKLRKAAALPLPPRAYRARAPEYVAARVCGTSDCSDCSTAAERRSRLRAAWRCRATRTSRSRRPSAIPETSTPRNTSAAHKALSCRSRVAD